MEPLLSTSGNPTLKPPPLSDPAVYASNPFERVDIAASRLSALDVPGAYTALVSPRELSPLERRSLADQWGLTRGDTWYDKILRTVTNPLVLVGMVMAIRYPLPLARDLFKYAPQLSGLARRTGFLRRMTGGIDDTFGDLPLAEGYKALTRTVHHFRAERADELAQGISAAISRGLPFNREMERTLFTVIERPKLLRDLRPEIRAQLEPLITAHKGFTQRTFKDVFEELDRQALRSTLKARKMSPEEFRSLVEQGSDRVQPILEAQSATRSEVYAQLKAVGIDTKSFENVAKRPNYVPHRVSGRSLKDFERETEELTLLTGLDRAQQQRAMATAGRTPYGLPRRGKMVPDPEHLESIRGSFQNTGQLDDLIGKVQKVVQDRPDVRTYSADYTRVMADYIHSLSRGYGWTVKGHGKTIVQGLHQLERSSLPHNQVRAQMLRNSYIPVALGRQSLKQLEASASWDDMRYGLVQNLQSGALAKLLPAPMKEWFSSRLVEDRGIFSLRNIGGRLAGHLTVGALGGNPVSSTWNMMQTLLTTIPVIGTKASLQGFSSVMKNGTKYFKARASGIGHEAAVSRTFPLFARAELEAAPVTEEALELLDRAWASGLRIPGITRPYDRVKTALMEMFRGSESIVRLTAFEGTMAKALKEGMAVADALPIARRVVETTQFLTGPANTPYLFLNAGPLLRQFGTFPFRYLNFLMGAATELGSGAKAGLGGRNWGTLGRALAASGLAYEGAQNFLDQDISAGLMFGALPSRPPGSFLAPLPFIPPALSLAFSAVQGLTTGDFTQLVRQAPLLVPGGVQMTRMSTAYAPGAAQTLGRQYADYAGKTPDGRIPIHSAEGELRGTVTPLQLHMMALGIPPGEPGFLQKERELSQYLLAQRERITGMKRQFVDSLLQNDVRTATQVQTQYQQAYPGLGKLQVTSQDFRAAQMRMMIPRLERILEQVPSEAREEMGQLILGALGQEAEGLLGVDPMMLQMPQGTIRKREVYRRPPPRTIEERLQRLDMERRRSPRPTKSAGGGPWGTGSPFATRSQSLQSSPDLTPF